MEARPAPAPAPTKGKNGASPGRGGPMAAMRRALRGRVDWRQILPSLRWTSFVTVVIAGLVWGWWSHRHEVNGALERVTERAELVSRYAQRLIETQTAVQASLAERARVDGPGFLDSAEFQRFLTQIEASQNFTHGIMIVDRQGNVVAASRRYLVASPLPAQDILDSLAEGGAPIVDRVPLFPSNVDSMILASPFKVPGFDGAVLSAFSVATVSDFLQAVALRPRQMALLMRADGKILSKENLSDTLVVPEGAPARQAIGSGDRGIFTGVAPFDGVERLHAFQRVEGVPVFALAGTPTGAITMAWLAKAVPAWMLLGVIGALSWLACVQAQRRVEAGMAERDRERRLVEAEALAAQRAHLVKEMNHRIKNNLSLISALIGIQMKAPGGLDGTELRSRIHAILEVHDMMYRADDGAHVDLGEMLAHLGASPALVPGEMGVTVQTEIEPGIVVGSDIATPIALVAAELVINAVKHAFAGRAAGCICIALSRSAPDEALLVVSDDGAGIPEKTARSSGTRIIRGLIEQIGGRLEISSAEGVRVAITFPLSRPQGA